MPVKIFVCHSHYDHSYLEEDSLLGFLRAVEANNKASFWHDGGIVTGDSWDSKIKQKIIESEIALILVSQCLLNSKYVIGQELPLFLKKRNEKGMILFPIILSACQWKSHEWLRQTQFLPRQGNIESNYYQPGQQKELFLNILEDLGTQIERIEGNRSFAVAPTSPVAPLPSSSFSPTLTPEGGAGGGVIFLDSSGTIRSASKHEVLRLGGHCALSGAGALLGLASQRGSILAKEEINSRGGIVAGGKRYLLDLVFYDDKYIPDEAVKAANLLIFQDKVKFMITTGGTGPTLASLPLFNDNRMLELQPLCYSKDSLGPRYPYAFRTMMTTAFYYRPFVQWIRQQYPAETARVAILDQNDALGWTTHEQALTVWRTSGAEVAWEGYYPAGTTDFTSILTTILAKGRPSAFDTGATPPGQLGPMIGQLRSLGFRGLIVNMAHQIPTDLQRAVKPQYLEGVIFPYPDLGNSDGTQTQKSYHDAFIKSFGEPFLPLSIPSYIGLLALSQAIEKADSLDSRAVVKTLESMQFTDTLMGNARWAGLELYSGVNHELTYDQYFCTVQNGKVVRVATVKPEIWT